MKKTDMLKPCPFCGGRKLTFIDYENIRNLDGSCGTKVFCLACGGATGIRTHDDAVALWNSRPVVKE